MQLLGATLAGRYRLDRLLGDGGMAAVFAGTDLLLNRAIAVKVLHHRLAGDPAFLARFWQEAQAAAAISHPNVVGVYDFGEHHGTSFIVLELVEGEPLNTLLAREGPLPPERAVAIVARMCEALHAAHVRGLVHRDVKPGNVMIGRGDAVKVMDFGLARAAEVACELTDPGTVVGTAYYISPEQATGSAASSSSDLYAVGVCLYELLSGQRPFSGSTPAEIAIQHVSATSRRLDELRPDLPPALVATVNEAMAKRPEDRPRSARALRQRLERAVGAPAVPRLDHRPAVANRPAPRPTPTPAPALDPGPGPAAGLPAVGLPAVGLPAGGLADAWDAPTRGADRLPPSLVAPAGGLAPASQPWPDRARRGRELAVLGRRRLLAAAALALFIIAIGSATMLSLRAEPLAAPPGGRGGSPAQVSERTGPSTSVPGGDRVAAPTPGNGGGGEVRQAAKERQKVDAGPKGKDTGKGNRGQGGGDQGGGGD